MNIFRFTKDLDFMVHENSKENVHAIMVDLGYEKQDFSSQYGNLDDYFEFISKNIASVPIIPAKPVTDDFRL